MLDPITVSRLARERQEEIVDRYVLGKDEGPLEAWVWHVGGSLMAVARKIMRAAQPRQNAARRAVPEAHKPVFANTEPCAEQSEPC